MKGHKFQMRLSCRYENPDKAEPGNTIADIKVEVLTRDGWEVFELNDRSPGFLMFVFTIFNCQHMYMRVNCAERALVLDTAEGSIAIGAGADWNIETLRVHFSGRLASGQANADDIDYIVSRMKQCPVSRNLREVPDAESTVTLA